MTEHVDHAQVRAHPPLIFLGFIVLALILGWIVPIPNPWLLALRWTGGLALLAGFILASLAISQMFKADTTPDPHQPVRALVRQGPYRFTRNPIYLGFLHIYLGVTLLSGTLWGILLAPLVVYTVNRLVIRAEEAYLEGKFGGPYLQYKASVRRWL